MGGVGDTRRCRSTRARRSEDGLVYLRGSFGFSARRLACGWYRDEGSGVYMLDESFRGLSIISIHTIWPQGQSNLLSPLSFDSRFLIAVCHFGLECPRSTPEPEIRRHTQRR